METDTLEPNEAVPSPIPHTGRGVTEEGARKCTKLIFIERSI